MKNTFYMLAIVSLISCTAQIVANNHIVNTAPTTGVADFNGKEGRYYVQGGLLHIDFNDTLAIAQYSTGDSKPEGCTGSFCYTDKSGINRTCHFKIVNTLNKKNMLPV